MPRIYTQDSACLYPRFSLSKNDSVPKNWLVNSDCMFYTVKILGENKSAKFKLIDASINNITN